MKNNSDPWDGWSISHPENKHGSLKLFDTSGMVCICGKRLVHKGIENGCHILACLNTKCNGWYQIPIHTHQDLEYPRERILRGWEPPIIPSDVMKSIQAIKITAVPVMQKQYVCRDCGCDITKEQAERTYREYEKALCVACEDGVKK